MKQIRQKSLLISVVDDPLIWTGESGAGQGRIVNLPRTTSNTRCAHWSCGGTWCTAQLLATWRWASGWCCGGLFDRNRIRSIYSLQPWSWILEPFWKPSSSGSIVKLWTSSRTLPHSFFFSGCPSNVLPTVRQGCQSVGHSKSYFQRWDALTGDGRIQQLPCSYPSGNELLGFFEPNQDS